MANALYDPGREGFLLGEIDADTAVIKCSICRSGSFTASHKFVSDFTGAGGLLIATVTLGSKTGTSGVFDAADVTFTAVAAQAGNAALDKLILYQASAVTGGADVAATAQRLIGYIDTATNLPVIANGGDIAVAWDNGANKIFKL